MIEVRDGKLFRDQFLRNCVAGHHLETAGLLDVTQDSPFTTQIGIFNKSRVFTCFVLSCGGFFANGLSTVCPFCRNWYDSWSLAHSSPTVSSVLANSIAQWISCELSRPSLLWRSWLPCAPMWAWKRTSTWHIKQGPVPFFFRSVGSEIVNFKVKLRRIK